MAYKKRSGPEDALNKAMGGWARPPAGSAAIRVSKPRGVCYAGRRTENLPRQASRRWGVEGPGRGSDPGNERPPDEGRGGGRWQGTRQEQEA